MSARQLQEQAAALFALAEDAFDRGKPKQLTCAGATLSRRGRRIGKVASATTDGAAALGHPIAIPGPAQERRQGLTHRREFFTEPICEITVVVRGTGVQT